jgi:amino acid transporter
MRWISLKSRLLGRPLASSEAEHQLLRKTLALPVFASDPLSSVAYATEEAMLVLALAGVGAYVYLTPVSFAVSSLLAIVVVSYRQTIRAYPEGGGAFVVSYENLGAVPGAVAASSLLTDYVLTVAVSVSAGVAAITSAVPELLPWRVSIALLFVVLVTIANLRGVKEASLLFAAPTYLFVATVFTVLVVGFIRCADGTCPDAISSGLEIEAEMGAVTVFLLLRAFASGSTALTGVEAVADGVQAFRHPKARNAAATLGIMGVISISMFLGISSLARLFDVRVTEETIDTYGTVLSQIGRSAFGGGIGFWVLQVATAAILVLAANTAYQDFPRLSAILAGHRMMPRQYRNRGDRLVFSNGVVTLALGAGLLIYLFDAEVSRLIQLYVVGVFTSFTLSQTGMVRRWLRTREPGWQRSVTLNAIGALTTAVVLVVVAVVKFSHGAWIVLIAVPLLVSMMLAIRRHYQRVAAQLRQVPPAGAARANRMLVLVAHSDEAAERAIRYTQLVRSNHVQVVHAVEPDSDDLIHTWDRLYPDHRLELIDGEDESVVGRLLARVREERDRHLDSKVTVVVSERFKRRSRMALLSHPNLLLLKARLLFEPGIAVTDVTSFKRRQRSGLPQVPMRRVELVVLVSDLTRPIRDAIAYAEALGPPVRTVHIDVDDVQRDKVIREWAEVGYGYELEVVPSPFREMTTPLVAYVRDRKRLGLPGTLVNVVIPEFIVPGRVTQALHNQTGLAVKAVLAPEPGVAVTSVPYHLSVGAPTAV